MEKVCILERRQRNKKFQRDVNMPDINSSVLQTEGIIRPEDDSGKNIFSEKVFAEKLNNKIIKLK